MNIRACGIALLIGASVASPHGSGQSNAQHSEHGIAATQERQEVVLVGAAEWIAPEWDYSVQLIDPSLRATQRGSPNPAGRLVLPSPQTSHAPAF